MERVSVGRKTTNFFLHWKGGHSCWDPGTLPEMASPLSITQRYHLESYLKRGVPYLLRFWIYFEVLTYLQKQENESREEGKEEQRIWDQAGKTFTVWAENTWVGRCNSAAWGSPRGSYIENRLFLWCVGVNARVWWAHPCAWRPQHHVLPSGAVLIFLNRTSFIHSLKIPYM